MKRVYPTIKELRNSLSSAKREFDGKNPWGFYVMRQTSFYPTWLLVRLGFSANATTLLGFIVGTIGIALITTRRYELAIAGAGFLALAQWLDYVDGNIARFRRESSDLGRFLDQACGNAIIVLLGLAAGFVATKEPYTPLKLLLAHWGIRIPPVYFVVLALLGVWLFTLRYLLGIIHDQLGALLPSYNAPGQRMRVAQTENDMVLLLIPLIILATVFSSPDAFIAIYALLFLLNVGNTSWYVMKLVLQGRVG